MSDAVRKFGVALVGCGNISTQYLDSIPKLANLHLVCVCDAVPEAAERVSVERGVPARPLAEALRDETVDVILNLTPPRVHAPLTIEALAAGKHVYLEKPFALTLQEGRDMIAAARAAGRRIGSAPDTVLGTGIQTARKLIDDGVIGRPVAATAFMMSPGHEAWHPDPAFYYAAGGGPLLDMGVYYLTALVTMLGPISSVAAMGSRLRSERLVPEGAPRAGDVLAVGVDTHVTANLRHSNGVITTLVVSFDSIASSLPPIEIYGTEASLVAPDPNRFSDPVLISRSRTAAFRAVETSAGYLGAGRGFGLSDLARAIGSGQPHRQSVELAFHVHEVMIRVLESVDRRTEVEVESSCSRPAPVPLGAGPDGA